MSFSDLSQDILEKELLPQLSASDIRHIKELGKPFYHSAENTLNSRRRNRHEKILNLMENDSFESEAIIEDIVDELLKIAKKDGSYKNIRMRKIKFFLDKYIPKEKVNDLRRLHNSDQQIDKLIHHSQYKKAIDEAIAEEVLQNMSEKEIEEFIKIFNFTI